MRNINLFRVILIVLFMFGFHTTEAQNCPIDPWILSQYNRDAKIFAFDEIVVDSIHPYRDSVILPESIINKYLGILSSVFKLDNSSTDSIFNTFYIHTGYNIYFGDNFNFSLDNTLPWVQNLVSGIFPTGFVEFDSIVMLYNLNLNYSFTSGDTAYFYNTQTSELINTIAICKLFTGISGVTSAYPEPLIPFFCFDSDCISYLNKLTFLYIEDGCQPDSYFKAWYYEIDSNCNAILTRVTEPVTSVNDTKSKNLPINIFPNPAEDILNITTSLQGNYAFQYQINNMLGAIVTTNNFIANDFSIDISALPTGIYLIHLQSDNGSVVKRFVKE